MVLGFADEIKKLGENIAASYDVRIGAVKDIFKNTHSTLKNFHTEHMHMSEEQKAALASFRKNLMDETRKMLDAFAKEHKGTTTALKEDLSKFHQKLQRETHTMINNFKTNFQEMAEELRKMLSGYYKGEIKKPVKDMLGVFHNEMQKLSNEFHQAHNTWMSFSRSMDAKKKIRHPTEAIEAPKPMAAATPRRKGKRGRKASRKR
jgi:predicted DNA-binding protein YlxM (UPF0122 family)